MRFFVRIEVLLFFHLLSQVLASRQHQQVVRLIRNMFQTQSKVLQHIHPSDFFPEDLSYSSLRTTILSRRGSTASSSLEAMSTSARPSGGSNSQYSPTRATYYPSIGTTGRNVFPPAHLSRGLRSSPERESCRHRLARS